MATDTRNLYGYFSSDADFRAWGAGIAAQIAAMGLVQTSDTGQINWTTVVRPALNTSAGYEVWRFADSLQATKPVFIRLAYGVGSSADKPRIDARVGTGTDGAGTLTGQVGTSVTLVPGGSIGSSAPFMTSICSGSTSRLNLFTHVNLGGGSGSWGYIIWVERTKTNLGVNTGDGIATLFASANSLQYQAIPFAGTIPAGVQQNPALSLDSGAGQVSSAGTNVALSPTIVCLGKAFFASWVAYINANIPKLMPFTVEHLGATHTMLPLGDTSFVISSMFWTQNVASSHAFAILWE